MKITVEIQRFNPESDSKSYQRPIFKKQNEKALAALNRMPPGEVKTLDKKLAKALTFYYDRKFALALPLFKEIAGLVETMDIMFRTNASGSWQTIQTYNGVTDGVYTATPTIMNNGNTLYYWSVNATDEKNTWTNMTYKFTTRGPPAIHEFTLDSWSHNNYGLSYPVTYMFDIPSNATIKNIG